jgi:[ribosomal protein S5]-alanine N-acetyltransferase
MTKIALMTERLVLLPAGTEDRDTLWALWRNPDVHRGLFDGQPPSRAQAARVLQDSLAQAEAGLGLWMLFPWGNSPPVGCVAALRTEVAALADPTHAAQGTAVEVMAALWPQHWGQGYASEALHALVRHAFESLGLPSLVATTTAEDRASQQLMQRLGFFADLQADGPFQRLQLYRRDAPPLSQRRVPRPWQHAA